MQYSVTIIKIASSRIDALYVKCASCRHFSGCEVGSPFCRVWGTVLSASWSLIDLCPHWAPHGGEERGPEVGAASRHLGSQVVVNRSC